jgi:hypothetical protein
MFQQEDEPYTKEEWKKIFGGERPKDYDEIIKKQIKEDNLTYKESTEIFQKEFPKHTVKSFLEELKSKLDKKKLNEESKEENIHNVEEKIKERNEIEEISNKLKAIKIDESNSNKLKTIKIDESKEQFSDDYYVHIDILKNPNKFNMAARINKFMITNNCFDPRRGKSFPLDLLNSNEKPTLKKIRDAIGVSKNYYEFWKVKKGFSLKDFREMVQETNVKDIEVKIVRIFDNDHDINTYSSNENYKSIL